MIIEISSPERPLEVVAYEYACVGIYLVELLDDVQRVIDHRAVCLDHILIWLQGVVIGRVCQAPVDYLLVDVWLIVVDVAPRYPTIGVSSAVCLHVYLAAARLTPKLIQVLLAINGERQVIVLLAVAVYLEAIERVFSVAIWHAVGVWLPLAVFGVLNAHYHRLKSIAVLVVYRYRELIDGLRLWLRWWSWVRSWRWCRSWDGCRRYADWRVGGLVIASCVSQ